MGKQLPIIFACALAFLLCGCAQQGGARSDAGPGSGAASATASQGVSDDADDGIGSDASDGAKSYTIARIDGEPDWGVIAQLDIDDVEWTDSFGIRAHAQLCHDGQTLYVRMWAEEQDVRATYLADDFFANCYEDSCLEFFLAPVTGDARYLNFEANPNLAMCNEIGTQKEGRIRLYFGEYVEYESFARTESGWEIIYGIPFEYIRTLYPEFKPDPGLEMRGNFYKCGNLTAHKHYLAWSHVDSDTPNFHVPESFGVLVLE